MGLSWKGVVRRGKSRRIVWVSRSEGVGMVGAKKDEPQRAQRRKEENAEKGRRKG
jgi:hypothetical protein